MQKKLFCFCQTFESLSLTAGSCGLGIREISVGLCRIPSNVKFCTCSYNNIFYLMMTLQYLPLWMELVHPLYETCDLFLYFILCLINYSTLQCSICDKLQKEGEHLCGNRTLSEILLIFSVLLPHAVQCCQQSCTENVHGLVARPCFSGVY